MVKFRDRKEDGGCQGLVGGEKEDLAFNGDRVSVLQDGKVLQTDGGDGYTQCECTSCHGTYT